MNKEEVTNYIAIRAVIDDDNYDDLLLNRVVETVNEQFNSYLVSSFKIKDRIIEGLLLSGSNIMNLITKIRAIAFPSNVLVGIGVSDNIAEKYTLDSVSVHQLANQSLSRLRDASRKKSTHYTNILLESNNAHRSVVIGVNTIFSLLMTIEGRWTKRQREIVLTKYFNNYSQIKLAEEFQVAQPTIQSALMSGRFFEYNNALKNLNLIFTEMLGGNR